jgi:hypothetical protein
MNVPMARTVELKLTVMGVPLEHQLLRLQTSSSGHSSPFTHLSSQDLSTAVRTAWLSAKQVVASSRESTDALRRRSSGSRDDALLFFRSKTGMRSNDNLAFDLPPYRAGEGEGRNSRHQTWLY